MGDTPVTPFTVPVELDVDPLGAAGPVAVGLDPEGVVEVGEVDPEVVPDGLDVLVPVVVVEGVVVEPVPVPLVVPVDPEVVPVELPDGLEPLPVDSPLDPDGAALATLPSVDPDAVEVPLGVFAVDPVLADAPVLAVVGDTGTFVLTLAPLPETAPLLPEPPITPSPKSRAKVRRASASRPPKIHQQGWQSGVSL